MIKEKTCGSEQERKRQRQHETRRKGQRQCRAVLGHLYSDRLEQVGGKSEMELRRRNIGGDDIIRLPVHIFIAFAYSFSGKNFHSYVRQAPL